MIVHSVNKLAVVISNVCVCMLKDSFCVRAFVCWHSDDVPPQRRRNAPSRLT